jgi:hypothetical protein
VVAQSTKRRLYATAAALTCVVGTAGCSDLPEGFQTACDHLAAAEYAVADGDSLTAKDELNRAYDWIVPAYEDTQEDGQRAALEDFSRAVNAALDNFGTEQGTRALADAKEACS